MDSPQCNPRRRTLHNTHSTVTTLVAQPLYTTKTSYSLKKSGTFHSPTSPTGEHDPVLSIPSLPRRSFTSAADLEALTSNDNRIAQIIGAVDRSLSGLEKFSSDCQETLVADSPPIPLFMLYGKVDDSDHMVIEQDLDDNSPDSTASRQRGTIRKHHTSDSGIGSTVSSSEASMSGDHAGMKHGMIYASMTSYCDSPLHCKAFERRSSNDYNNITTNESLTLNEASVQTGINGLTASATGFVSGTQHALSEYACRQIQKHIILPIIREEKLKDFHPLVSGIPYRVARKEITCLRDLEKVLLWLAPVSLRFPVSFWSSVRSLIFGAKKWSATKTSFLNFCETSIQCIHTTVNHLNEHDQQRPTDRPYTNGYFLDLVEQVRQYATMLAASRARIALEPTLPERPDDGERLHLVGGLGQTGQAAELVRTKNGRSISLRTGEEVLADYASSPYQHGIKRSVSEESDGEVLRSMARRRKSAQPTVKDIQKCNECDKVFKRPCDLTLASPLPYDYWIANLRHSKHEKTHSRPWKCNDIGCKYNTYGWPTEKERDRHVNDKHSSTPSMYKCQYSPCPYESKRESNCKQHMEKAHGWQYVRSKNNGKNGKKPQTGKTPPTPQISTPGSYIFDAPTPEFNDPSAYYETSSTNPTTESINESLAATELTGPYANDTMTGFADTFGAFDPAFSWNGQNDHFGAGSMTIYSSNSNRPSWDAALTETPALSSAFENPLNTHDEEPIFGNNFDWSNMNHDVASLNIQLVTPATSVHTHPFDAFSRNPSVSHEAPPCGQISSLSPGAQGDAMLYSPYSMNSHDLSADEGFVDFNHDVIKPTHDFSLFDSGNATSSTNITANENMFQDLSTFTAPANWSQQLMMGDLLPMEE
ncbi:copper-binding transcription factor [Xylographa bjoerkii]|nr:copper-binding transcription factor [Xylographa bjoerkii]